MLAKKRYAQRAIQNKAIPTFFLFLVLLSVSLTSALACDCSTSSPSAVASDVVPAGGIEIPWGQDIYMDVTLSANSVIPLFLSGYVSGGYLCGTLFALEALVTSDIKAVKWQLKNPSGKVVYEKDVTGDWKGFSVGPVSIVCVPEPEIRVPAFATGGSWTLTLMVSKTVLWFWEHTYDLGRFHFNVGESSLADHLFAPIYLTWGGIMGQGGFSVALPCIFWLSSPVWFLAIMFIMLAFYMRSIRLAVRLIKEGGKRFKEAIAKK